MSQLPELKLCGCRATRHPAFTNCLCCGIIYCVEERSFLQSSAGKCVFCSSTECKLAPREAITALQQQPQTTINAYNLKDKLLQFDLECAMRSHVRDAQADYYENADVWLSEDEKARIDEKQRLRREQLKPSNRCKLLSLAVDKTGRRVTSATSFGATSEDEYPEAGDGAQNVVRVSIGANDSLASNRLAAGAVYRHFLQHRTVPSGLRD